MESQIISLLLSRENFDKAKALVTKDMFDKKYKTIFDAVMHYHTKYEGDLSKDNLFMVHKNLYPAMPDSTRELVEEAIQDIPEDVEGDPNFVMDTLTEFWRREMARKVGETAIDIWNGDSANFGDLRMMIDQIINQDSATGILSMQREETDVEELFLDFEADPDFPFPITTLADEIAGTYRGNLGIIFARPESGKSSFCAFLAAEAIRKGHRVGYIMNEETAKRMKSRVLTAYFNVHKETYMQEIENIKREWFTNDMIENFFHQARKSYAEGLASLYTYERQIPEIAETKIRGLKNFYGVTSKEGLEFFEAHKAADVIHRKECEKLLDALTEEEKEKAEKASVLTARYLWNFLSGMSTKHNLQVAA